MATLPNAYLKPDPVITLRDPQHVAFSINPAALKTIALAQRHRNEINMLVKSVDLPNYTIQTETLNQYNRKKNTQYQHKFANINIKFHDDNMGLINQLWQNYYSYYYADSTSAGNAGAYNRNATRSSSFINNAYGLDNGSSIPFFNYITIYQMAKKEFLSYKLHNPIITAWNHMNVDYAQNTLRENQATIQYEAVSYGSGIIAKGEPEGFVLEHYDQTPSPLKAAGLNGFTSASPTFQDVNNVASNAQDFLSNAIKTVNGYSNTGVLPTGGALGAATAINTVQPGQGGLQGFAFPSAANNTSGTTATGIKLG